MASVRNCPECGKVFTYDGNRNLCPRCIDKEEKKYLMVRKYVKDNPGASINEVAEETEVEEELVLRFLREGRLHSKGLDAADIASECARCGKQVLTGRYCQDCLLKMTKELSKAAGISQAQKEETPEKSKKDPRHKWHTDRD